MCEGYGYDCAYAPRRKKAGSFLVPVGESKDGTGETSSHHVPTKGPPLKPVAPNPAGNGHHHRIHESQERIADSDSSTPARMAMVLEPTKNRFTCAHSAMAFPRSIGLELHSENVPRLHSFAWNCGTRAELAHTMESKLSVWMALEDAQQFFNTYFEVIDPSYGFIRKDSFLQRCTEHWNSSKPDIEFEAVICGVIGLGSLFSGSGPCRCEIELVDHARLILDMGVSHPPGLRSFTQVVAWILRVLYLRATTRPHLSWLASCQTMHLAEAVGLHQEMNAFQLTSKNVTFCPEELDIRRRTFWVAWSLNRLLAAEYGRSPVDLRSIGCQSLAQNTSDCTSQFVALASSLPEYCVSPTQEVKSSILAFDDATAVECESAPLRLVKADVCISIFRRLRIVNARLQPQQVVELISIIRTALADTRTLATSKRPWWNIASTPFQSICVLISINSRQSLELLREALETLESVVNSFDTHLAKEALTTARMLVARLREEKAEEIALLGQNTWSQSWNPDDAQIDLSGLFEDPIFKWPVDYGSGWGAPVFPDQGLSALPP